MKTNLFNHASALGSLLVISLSPVAFAGPDTRSMPPPEEIRAQPPGKKEAPVATSTPADLPAMACPACKTKPLLKPILGRWDGAESDVDGFKWFIVGSQHACEHCDGAIILENGAITNTMQPRCSMCGEAASLCLASVPRER